MNFIFAYLFVFISIFTVLIFAGVQKNEKQYYFYHYRYRIVKASNDASRLKFSECFQPRLFEYMQSVGSLFSVIFVPADNEKIQYFGQVKIGADELEERSGRSAGYFSLSRESRGVYYISSDVDVEKRLSEFLDLKLDRLENRTGFFRIVSTFVLQQYFFAVLASFVLLVFLMNGASRLDDKFVKAHQLCGATFWKYQVISLKSDAFFWLIGSCLGVCSFAGIAQGAFFGYEYEVSTLAAAFFLGIFMYFIVRVLINYIRYWLLRGGGNVVSRIS